MDILLKAFLTRSSPSISSTQPDDEPLPLQNPSSHINILKNHKQTKNACCVMLTQHKFTIKQTKRDEI